MSDINITVQDEIVEIDVIDTPVYVEVTNSPGPAGPAGVGVPVGGTTGQVLAKTSATNYATAWVNPSGGTWGSITGTLSNQTDLQNALNAKFDDPTGTTAQYLRGDGSLATFPAIPSGTVSSVGLTMPSAFSVANSPVTLSGTLAVTATGDTTQYIAGDGSLVAFPITGQAGTLVREVRNNSGATITKGTVVYINGASGNRPTIAKAIATTDATSAQTFGLVQADISNNSNGYIVAFGDLDGLNTSAFTEGAQLYLSSTVLGGYTTTKQYAPAHLVYIGVVTRSHVNQGRIEVRIQNGYEMDELHDVAAQTPTNNDGLFYNSTNSLWENKSIATALGYTPANAATTLTINGVTYDLSTSRTWTVAAGISGSGTSGQVTYWSGASAVSGSNNLYWDNANSRLGIGTNTPATTLDVRSSLNAYTGIDVTNSSSGNGARSLVRLYNNNGNIGQLSIFGSGTGASFANKTFFEASKDFVIGTDCNTASGGTSKFQIYVGGYNSSTSPQLSFHATANLSIGSTSDLGQRLQVYGDTLLRGSGNSSTTTALTVQNSSSTVLGRFQNDGAVFLGAGGWLAIGEGQRYLYRSLNTTAIFTIGNDSTVGASIDLYGSSHATNANRIFLNGSQVRITSASVLMTALPTSSAGLPSGALWNNGGVINIV